ncbi:hypothetical protein [Candidatus Accumulibacter regalis]|jgi:Na+/H+ antiporter NhaD/arsenite permease-like protein|uniref:hypothetical protein n=1 Tax=Candidatus Accumulibacter TaxID=327159 RepID=UPI000313E3DF|nr:hypothetical protein [Accumulibacter sp.]MBO3716927.1 hypothetical protein [Accumulibacter sp.]
MLSNLLGLLLGFALLARHFEESRVPDALPRYLPGGWQGGFVLLVMIFVLLSFLDNIAAALIGGTVARIVFRHRLHIGYLAAIVAASNAGGSGCVLGDTTTMMWIDGVSPLDVTHAYVATGVALVFCGIPAALQQHRYSPIVAHSGEAARIDWARVAIVGFILLSAIVTNVTVNVLFPEVSDRFPFLGAAVWLALLLATPLRRPEWSLLPEALNLDSSVGPRLKMVEASIGKGLRPIFATAPQFPLGGSGALEKSNVHSGLAAVLGFNRGI